MYDKGGIWGWMFWRDKNREPRNKMGFGRSRDLGFVTRGARRFRGERKVGLELRGLGFRSLEFYR